MTTTAPPKRDFDVYPAPSYPPNTRFEIRGRMGELLAVTESSACADYIVECLRLREVVEASSDTLSESYLADLLLGRAGIQI